MKPYLDAGFLFTLIVKTHGTGEAVQILSSFPAPYELNLVHRLQVELFFGSSSAASGENLQKAALEGKNNWFRYVQEGVFNFVDADWDSALKVALYWCQLDKMQVSHLLLILHPAIALIQDFTHFLSFDPRSREIAAVAGLKLLPERL